MMAVEIRSKPAVGKGLPRELFSLDGMSRVGSSFSFDVAADGKRFVTVGGDWLPTAKLQVVLNWFEELKQRVPTGR